MVKNYTICNIEVIDKRSKLLVDEVMEMCADLSPRKILGYLKDDKGSYRFLKGTRTTVKGDFLVDINSFEEDIVVNRYNDYLCKNCRIVCRVDMDDPKSKNLYERCYNEIREVMAGVKPPSISDEESPSGTSKGLRSLISESNTFGILGTKNREELSLENYAVQLENKVNEIVNFVNENKLKVDRRSIEDISKRLVYSSDLLKSMLKELK